MGKKSAVVAVAVLVLLVLLIPTRATLKDGGSIQYKALTYEVTKVHSLISEDEMKKDGKVEPYDEGLRIKVLGFEVYDNVR